MPLPTKSRYTISEAAHYIASAMEETVSRSQLIDWGTQGFYGLYMLADDCHVKYEGRGEVVEINGAVIKFHPTATQVATLEQGYTIKIDEGFHDGRKVIFVKSRTEQYRAPHGGEERPVNFNITSVVFLGKELDAFIAEHRKPTEQENSAQTALSDGERNTLLRQIAGMALVIAEHAKRYKRGDKPNASQIATAVDDILADLPDANTHGLGDTNLRTNISAGLELLMKLKK